MKTLLSLFTFFLCLAGIALAEPIVVTDSKGTTITLEQPAKRIVSLSPSTTETLFDIGAGERIVGTSSWSNYPEAAKEIEIVNDYYSVNIERIQELEPDLIVLWRNQVEGALEKLGEMNVPIYHMDPMNLEEIAAHQINMGKLTGNNEQAQAASQQVLDFVAQYQAMEKTPVSFFTYVWHEPIYTVEKDGFIASVFELCGGENVLKDVTLNGSQVNQEAIIGLNPEKIFYFSQSDEGLAIWDNFPSLSAVKNNQRFWISSDLTNRPTMSLLKGATEICSRLQGSN